MGMGLVKCVFCFSLSLFIFSLSLSLSLSLAPFCCYLLAWQGYLNKAEFCEAISVCGLRGDQRTIGHAFHTVGKQFGDSIEFRPFVEMFNRVRKDTETDEGKVTHFIFSLFHKKEYRRVFPLPLPLPLCCIDAYFNVK